MNGKGCRIMGKVFKKSQITEEPKFITILIIVYGSFHISCFAAPKYVSYAERYLKDYRLKR